MKNFISLLLLALLSIQSLYAANESWAEKCKSALNKPATVIDSALVAELSQKPVNKNVEVYFLIAESNIKNFENLLQSNNVSLLSKEEFGKRFSETETYFHLKGFRSNLVALFAALGKDKNSPYVWAGLQKNPEFKIGGKVYAATSTVSVMLEIPTSKALDEILPQLETEGFVMDKAYTPVPMGKETYIIRGQISSKAMKEIEKALQIKVWPDSQIQPFNKGFGSMGPAPKDKTD